MDVAGVRLAASGVGVGGGLRTVAEVVEHLGAVQAQDFRQLLWSIGLRADGVGPDGVADAIERREVLRSWGMRGTLHVVPAVDAEWMRRLFAPRILARTTGKAWAYHGVDQALMDRAADVLSTALDGGDAIPRPRLSALLEAEGVPNDAQQHYIVFAHLSHLGLLCHGPRVGRHDALARFDRWAPPQRELSGDGALVELARRFCRSHGPAGVADFANWAGLARADAETGFAGARDVLEEVASLPPARGTHLVPAYDELVIGYADRSPLFERWGEIPISTYNGMFHATVVVDGQVAGTWKNTLRARRVDVDVRVEPGVDHEAIVAAADRFAAFHDRQAVVRFGEPPDRTRRSPTWGARTD